MINVMDFGAHGDGEENDAVAIQSVVDACLDNAVLLFPPGFSFRLTEDVTVRKSLTIFGYGATILEDGGSIRVEGSVGHSRGVKGHLTRNKTELKVADTTPFHHGDRVIVESPLFSEFLTIDTVEMPDKVGVEEFLLNDIRMDYIDLNSIRSDDRSEEFQMRIFYPVSVRILGITFQSNAPSNSRHLRIKYAQHCLIRDCLFTGEGDKEAKGFRVDKSRQIEFLNCVFRDITYWGLRISRSSFVQVRHCHFENCSTRPLQARLCNDVTFSENTAVKNAGFIFCVENCCGCAINNNQIRQVPQTYTEARSSATSQAGIFVLGSERVVITGNLLVNCIGEGSIYVRRSNFLTPVELGLHPTSVPGLPKVITGKLLLPTRNILISNNSIRNEIEDVDGQHTASIFLKSSGEDIRISGNDIRSSVGGIVLWGEYRQTDIVDNTIQCARIGIQFDQYKGEPGKPGKLNQLSLGTVEVHFRKGIIPKIQLYYPSGYSNHIRIAGNRITTTPAYGGNALIGLRLDSNPVLQLTDNAVQVSHAVTGEEVSPLVNVHVKKESTEQPIGSGQVLIRQNLLKSCMRGQVGFNVKLRADEGRFLMGDNLVDIHT